MQVAPDGSCFSLELAGGRAKGATRIVAHYLNPFKKGGQAKRLYAHKDKLQGLWLSPSGALHAVGGKYHTNTSGEWTARSVPGATANFISIWGLDDETMWLGAMNFNNECTVFRRDGLAWHKHTIKSAGDAVYAFTGSSTSDVYAATEGGIAHFDGKRWKIVKKTPCFILDLCAATKSELYACGRDGTWLFKGNAKKGFKTLIKGSPRDDSDFYHVVVFQKKAYLTQHWRVVSLKGKTTKPEWDPEPSASFPQLSANSNVLWAANSSGLRCFNGKTWRDVPFVGASPAKPKKKAAAKKTTAKKEAPAEKAKATPPAKGVQRYEFKGGGSNKFWETACSGKKVTVRYGRIGTSGQTKFKSFDTPAAAKEHQKKLIGEKLKKGYKKAKS